MWGEILSEPLLPMKVRSDETALFCPTLVLHV